MAGVSRRTASRLRVGSNVSDGLAVFAFWGVRAQAEQRHSISTFLPNRRGALSRFQKA